MILTRSRLAKLIKEALNQRKPTLTKPHLVDLVREVLEEIESVSWDEDYGMVKKPLADGREVTIRGHLGCDTKVKRQWPSLVKECHKCVSKGPRWLFKPNQKAGLRCVKRPGPDAAEHGGKPDEDEPVYEVELYEG